MASAMPRTFFVNCHPEWSQSERSELERSRRIPITELKFEDEPMNSNLIDMLFIFMLACFIGFEVIRHVSPLLHTPLMSLTNALDAIAVVGAIVLVGERKSEFATILGVIAIVAATSNVVGGFFITDRMLKMFKTSRPVKK
jgi:NAD(P) transhydrogenase subunit alpha